VVTTPTAAAAAAAAPAATRKLCWNGNWRTTRMAAVYAPIPKNAAIPRWNSPACPTTTFSPRARTA
jgi:hypothetical protein